MTAALGQDDRTLAAVTMGQEDGKFQSFLVLYHTDSDKMVATTPVDGGVAYALETLQREFCAVTEQGLYLLDRLTIYDKYLTEVATLPDVSEVRAVLMRADGSAVLAGASGASLYLP